MAGKNRKGRGGHAIHGRSKMPQIGTASDTSNNELLSKIDASESSCEEDAYSSDPETKSISAKNMSIQASLSSNSTKGSVRTVNDSRSSIHSEWSGSLVDSANEHENHRPNDDKTNPKQFIDKLLDALYDDNFRRTLSNILLEPLLDRVRDLELKQSKTETIYSSLE